MPEHHDTGEEKGGGVGESLSSDVGGGSVNGLEDGGITSDLWWEKENVSSVREVRRQKHRRTFPEGVSPSPPMSPALQIMNNCQLSGREHALLARTHHISERMSP